MVTSPAVMRSRSVIYWMLAIAALGIAYVLSARSFGTVTSETGPQLCGPAVFGRVQPLPAPECAPHLEYMTAAAGVAVVIGAFLVVAAIVTRFRAGRRVPAYRY